MTLLQNTLSEKRDVTLLAALRADPQSLARRRVRRSLSKQCGFTMVELIVTMVIIGIMAIAVLPRTRWLWLALGLASAVLVWQRDGLWDAELSSLRHMFDTFSDSKPAANLEEYSETNLAFHQAIFKLGGSKLMTETVQNLLIHVRAIRKMTISKDDRASRSIVDHMKIIDALEKRDTDLAERLTRQHTLDLAAYVEKYCDFLT